MYIGSCLWSEWLLFCIMVIAVSRLSLSLRVVGGGGGWRMRCVSTPAASRAYVSHRDAGLAAHTKFFAQNDQSMTVEAAYQQANKVLRQLNVSESEESARHILSHVAKLGTRYSDFLSAQHQSLTVHDIQQYERLLQLRVGHWPIQYIIGNWDFYGHTFTCKPPILIPRPETEELVEHIVTGSCVRNAKKANRQLRILDIGSGSGAIGIALASALPKATVQAIDINSDAVELSLLNARSILGINHQHRYKCIHSSFADFVSANVGLTYDIVVSNPPYIPSCEIATLQAEVQRYEDRRALDGGVDGLDMVWDLVEKLPSLMSSGGELWMEVHHTHPKMIEDALPLKSSRWNHVQSINDFSSLPRFVQLRIQ